MPEDQPAKLKLIAQGARVLGPALNPESVDDPPTDQENVESLKSSVKALRTTAGEDKGPGAVASRRLADALEKLANSSEATRNKAQAIFVDPLKIVLEQLKNFLQAKPVTLDNLPPDIVNSWKTKDGLMRVEALPKGDPNDNDNLRRFASAVLVAEPTAIGGPVSILKSGDTVVSAFVHAGIYALLVISDPLGSHCGVHRRADDPGAASGRGRRDDGNLRADQAAAQLRQHRRPAAVARHRRRLQDLLHRGVALGAGPTCCNRA